MTRTQIPTISSLLQNSWRRMGGEVCSPATGRFSAVVVAWLAFPPIFHGSGHVGRAAVAAAAWRVSFGKADAEAEARAKRHAGHLLAEDVRFNEVAPPSASTGFSKTATAAEFVRVRGHDKVLCHLMFGVLSRLRHEPHQLRDGQRHPACLDLSPLRTKNQARRCGFATGSICACAWALSRTARFAPVSRAPRSPSRRAIGARRADPCASP